MVLNVYICTSIVNVLFDTGGGGVFLVDLGTLKQIVESPDIVGSQIYLVDASGNVMDVTGEIPLPITILGTGPVVNQNFCVLSS